MFLLKFLVLGYLLCTAAEQVLLKPPGQANDVKAINHEFTLQHIFHHGVGPVSCIHRRFDIPADEPFQTISEIVPDATSTTQARPLSAISVPIQIHRLSDRKPSTIEPLLDAAFHSNSLTPYSAETWEIDQIHGPKIDDKETIISLARMSAAAYTASTSDTVDDLSTWSPVTPSASNNNTIPIGWETIGLRGQVFVSNTTDIVIIALKGTSPPYYPGPKETTDLDRENDNLLFSCCCGDSKYFYSPSCSCSSGVSPSHTSSTTATPYPDSFDSFTEPTPQEKIIESQEKHNICNKTCQIENLKSPDRYWFAAREIYTNISLLYPRSQIWLTGHSLGGAMASLLGTAYGLPVVTFEAPGEAAAAWRLSLPVAPPITLVKKRSPQLELKDTKGRAGDNLNQIYHFGHTADPIYTGDCHSFWSTCQISGYFFETKCHAGFECTYDTVGDLKWINWIPNHRLSVMESVLEKYAETAKCVPVDENCIDCEGWDFQD